MAKTTVAVAEDHHLLRQIIVLTLRSDGCDVVAAAENGHDLLNQLKVLPSIPEVCITDLYMPFMDGFELIPQLRRLYPLMKIVVFSTYDDAATRHRASALGVHAFVSKSGSPQQLNQVINRFKETADQRHDT